MKVQKIKIKISPYNWINFYSKSYDGFVFIGSSIIRSDNDPSYVFSSVKRLLGIMK